ncbi:type IV pili methyl-accepting chemotaxis transducer N-terminal domain-containing protein [Microbulbifer hydrolyticus]|uniref:Nitrate/nitrite-specific signal transduction histidine kinase n=1 Tax=Microbulbifer hydrolyticus TaxID=48074 RepID=A0A6P1TA54_9GAMM|nr:type IV pili methyl-accepting chemotaxis transducer N-terminal domain-containing protein [Microbulbifer hydrolyticus]MBB5213144.1 nitrate/nitrite-specific signal transduction histidine kinase [Microbulbifer hydrolyticus]QHQ38651.1 pilus assembly protein PilP [Microbulbifer hydrolyticus]
MKYAFALILLFGLFPLNSSVIAAEATPTHTGFNMGDAINMAGRQRMLSQRITQAYILRGIQPQSEKHQQVFQRSMAEFERNLGQLLAFEPAAPVRSTLKRVQNEWQAFAAIARQPVNKFNAAELFKHSNTLLPAAHTYVMRLQALANHSSAELVNVSGRQRMLSQRIAKNYVAQFWGVAGSEGTKLLYEDLAEFEQMLAFLLQSPLNTPEITRNLRKTQGHLNYASRGFDGEMHMSEARQIHVVTGTTDIMLRNMNVVTGQYAELLNAVEIASR